MRFVVLALGVVCALATAVVVLVVRAGSVSSVLHPASSGTAVPTSSSQVPDNAVVYGKSGLLPQVGIVTNSLKNFQKATSAYPTITVHYLSWGTPFPAATILSNRRLGAATLLVLEPERVSLPGIADGSEDTYLKTFAAAEQHLGLPILISFAPEANGNWYPWGAHHITPALYIGMWRHVHDVIQKNGGTKITWLWQMNVPWPQSEPISLLWPGHNYVNEVGIDGQIKSSGATFSSIFAESLTQVRNITSDPILISEVSVQAGPDRPREITGLFAGACQEHLEGVILFDIHSEWQFDDDAQTVTAFKRGATTSCK